MGRWDLCLCVALLSVVVSGLTDGIRSSIDTPLTRQVPSVTYTSNWAVKLYNVDPAFLTEQGYEVVKKLSFIDNTYVIRHRETNSRHLSEERFKFTASHDVTESLLSHPDVEWAEQQILDQKHTRITITDPLFEDQWHLVNTGQFGGVAGVDANVQPAWDKGFNGTGVRIAIVDDGYQTTHPDLSPRYKSDSSYSFNNPVGNSPSPNVSKDFHGTSAAGVALADDNSVCGVGAAFAAEGAGIRLISAAISDATEAEALTYQNQLNDIYSNSWGPEDNGLDFGGAATVTQLAIQSGVANGRGGLGTIYVWAGGNGATSHDNVNYDSYANSIFAIAVGAIGNNGKQSYYSEPGAPLLVVAPSSSITSNAGIRTTDLTGANGYSSDNCADDFGGTSSACPLVSGVIALMLQANQNLTWRDVPYILATTAVKNDPTDSDWTTNGAGLHVNHKYGFGKIDADAATQAALTHKNLPSPTQIDSNDFTVPVANRAIADFPGAGTTVSINVDDDIIVEKVLLNINIDHDYSGDVEIVLESPQGTKSVMATGHAYVAALWDSDGSAYRMGIATFGTSATFTPIQAAAAIPSPSACGTITNCAALSGKIAIVKTLGECLYSTQALNVQNCGALAYIPVSADARLPGMAGTNAAVTIPCGFISQASGQKITAGEIVRIMNYKYDVNNYEDGWALTSSRLLGESSKGTWKVTVKDIFPEDTGTFNSYSLSLYGHVKRAGSNDVESASNILVSCGAAFLLSLLVLFI